MTFKLSHLNRNSGQPFGLQLFNEAMGWLFSLTSLVIAGMVLCGCATPQQRAERHAWNLICSYAPHVGGQEIELREQRAMDVVDAWSMSVKEVDEYCAKR